MTSSTSGGTSSKSKSKSGQRNFKLSDCYYSMVRKEFLDDFLKKEGDFLVRKSSGDTSGFVISVFWKGKIRHINPIQRQKGGSMSFSFGKNAFKTIEELVTYHCKSGVPFNDDLGIRLITPINRLKTTYKQSDIEILAKLGEGNFGDVYQVRIKSENALAAMKTLKAMVDAGAREAFEKEMKLMKTLCHENVVGMIGIVQMEKGNKGEMRILLELINQGSLEKLLRTGKVTDGGKCKICTQVACGMDYLHQHRIIHRDLAARNVLVHRHENGSITAKVSDFGLSRVDESGNGYSLRNAQKMPVRWMAPESFIKRT